MHLFFPDEQDDISIILLFSAVFCTKGIYLTKFKVSLSRLFRKEKIWMFLLGIVEKLLNAAAYEKGLWPLVTIFSGKRFNKNPINRNKYNMEFYWHKHAYPCFILFVIAWSTY